MSEVQCDAKKFVLNASPPPPPPTHTHTHTLSPLSHPVGFLPQNETDETQIQQAGDDVVLPTELAKMIAEDNQEESHKQSVLGQLSNIQNVDIDQLKDKAQATLEDLKKQTENCSLM